MATCKKCGYQLEFGYDMGGGCSNFTKIKGDKLFKFVSKAEWQCPMCNGTYTPDGGFADYDFVHTDKHLIMR
jgi:rubredoxin